MKKIILFVSIILLLPAYVDALPKLKNNMSRCELKIPVKWPSMLIRGTGYYWVEYLTKSFPDNKQLILLIRSNVPLYDFRGISKSAKHTCNQQTIINYLWIKPTSKNPYIKSFDCHWADDEPYPLGEAYFGYVGKTGPGFHKPTESWRIKLKGEGKGGNIEKMDKSLRVYCTVLPPIDAN